MNHIRMSYSIKFTDFDVFPSHTKKMVMMYSSYGIREKNKNLWKIVLQKPTVCVYDDDEFYRPSYGKCIFI